MEAIDLFAGLGGFTTGAEQAGCKVLWAANHWPVAVKVHAANHPLVQHVTQDLHQANWAEVPRHDLMCASPACTGHSKARGVDRPHHDASRSTAWAVVSAAETCRPPVILVENVPEFRDWVFYAEWSACLEKLGYTISPHIIDAADLGVPQHRVRLFLVCTRSKAPLALDLPRRTHRTAREIIDFSSGRWRPIHGRKRPLAANTLARIKAGRAEHGDRFLVAYYGNSRGGRSLDRPIGTITTRDRYAVIDGDRMRMVSVDEYKVGMAFPASYLLPVDRKTAVHLLGNAVCPLVAKILIDAVRAAG